MRSHRIPWALPVAILATACTALLPASAPAATALVLDLPSLVAASDLVIRGTVGPASCRMLASGRIVTDTVVRVDEALSGTPGGEDVVVTTLGGEIGDRGQRVPGSPVLGAGDEVVLFLHRTAAATPARASVVGLAQGAFHVTRSSGLPLLVRHLDGMVLQGCDAVPIPEDLDALRRALRALPAPGGTR